MSKKGDDNPRVDDVDFQRVGRNLKAAVVGETLYLKIDTKPLAKFITESSGGNDNIASSAGWQNLKDHGITEDDLRIGMNLIRKSK